LNGKTDNTGVMLPYIDGNGHTRRVAYGRIKRIFEHRRVPGGPALVFAEVQWLTPTRTIHRGNIQLVKDLGARDVWNQGENPFILLSDIYAQNIVFPPLKGDPDNWKASCRGELVCVYRRAETPIDFTAQD
jgi:hypothetical protein